MSAQEIETPPAPPTPPAPSGDPVSKQDQAYRTIHEVRQALSGLGDSREFRLVLMRTWPPNLVDGTGCDGSLREYDSPEELTEANVREEFGGGKFKVLVMKPGKAGFKHNEYFKLGGAPRLPAHMLEVRRAATDRANGAAASAAETPILKSLIEQQGETLKRLEALLTTTQAKLAESETARARAEIERDQYKAQPALVREEKSAERSAVAQEQTHALTILKSASEMQASALRDRAEAAERVAADLRASQGSVADTATAPLKQYLEMMREQHRQDMAAADKRFEQQMTLESKRADHQIAILREENTRLRDEAKSKKGGLEEVSSIIDMVIKISGKVQGEKEPPTPLDRIFEAINNPQVLEKLPAAFATVAGGLRGAPITVVQQPNPALPPGQPAPAGQPAQPPGPTPEQAQTIANVVAALKHSYTNKVEPNDCAQYMKGTIGPEALRLILAQPVDQLIQALGQKDPSFQSPAADQYLRQVYVKVQELIR